MGGAAYGFGWPLRILNPLLFQKTSEIYERVIRSQVLKPSDYDFMGQ
jgi:hypothetical protein